MGQHNDISALNVAAYIVAHTGKLSTLKLQRLVYYAQVWSLVWEDTPLFREPIEAWINGPAIRELHAVHRGNLSVQTIPNKSAKQPSRRQQKIIDAVLDYYGKKSWSWLGVLAQIEDPWRTTREGLSVYERSDRKISHRVLRAYYTTLPVPVPQDSKPIHTRLHPTRKTSAQQPYIPYMPNINVYAWMRTHPSWKVGMYGWDGMQSPTLTRYEKTLLHHLSEGKNRTEIARAAGKQPIQVSHALEMIRAKIGAIDDKAILSTAIGLGVFREPADVTIRNTLTQREVRILKYTDQGWPAKDIAKEFDVSASCIRTRLTIIRHKLRVRTTEEAIDRAHRFRLLPSERQGRRVALPALQQLHANESASADLTDRERETLHYLVRGVPSRSELGKRLGLTTGTAIKYVQRLRWKLGAETSARIVAKARELGIIPKSAPLSTAEKPTPAPRWQPILRLAAQGHCSYKDICRRSVLSERVIYRYVREIKAFFGVSNLADAVRIVRARKDIHL